MDINEGRKRVVIENVQPELDHGRFPIKRIAGESITVEADIFADGHDALSCEILFRKDGYARWNRKPMAFLVNDRWRADFQVDELGEYLYTVQAWVDAFETWRRGLVKKLEAGQDVSVDILTGAELLKDAGTQAKGGDKKRFLDWSKVLKSDRPLKEKTALALDSRVAEYMAGYPDRRSATVYERELCVVVDRERAGFSTWYEIFPRSCTGHGKGHGTFRECKALLPGVAKMGFDVLYLPPIHPIGYTHRKGKNNTPGAGPDDPGSPWAIGSEEGGHKAIHPALGGMEEFRDLLAEAAGHGMEIALDMAFQCSPDHPYVREHPEWFRRRPDGSIRYAENPPKRYEDIYPLDFECDQWRALWEELKSVFLFWIGHGIKIFRVDNPHTKPFAFWEWVIREIKRDHPEVIFLAEAFTRPKVMYRLAKVGFTQSYSYFAWRNAGWEITRYFEELTQTDLREFFRPHLWPNTPDILAEYLQTGGRPAFMIRLVLAATLGANYGIYGPAFELCEDRARETGSEEYLDSEKYEIRSWDWEDPASLRDFITRVNRIRKENPALQRDRSLRFHRSENDQIICYSKHTEDLSNTILVAVNLDPFQARSGRIHLPLEEMGIDPFQPYQVHDLLGGARYMWNGPRNDLELNPRELPAQIFRIRRRVRTEQDFDYFM